jgi:predicted HTH domain antitoxin
MEITIRIPEDLARSLGQEGGDLSRRTLEALAIDGYRSGALSEEQVRRILGFGTRMQVHEFLKEHHVYLNYGPEDLEQDMQTLRQVQEKESARTE